MRAVRSLASAGVMAIVLGLTPIASDAGTTGKVSGRVLDDKGQPVAGANVTIPAARVGAMSDLEGRYVILNVPAGTHELKASLLGYQAVTVQNVLVSADQTTSLDLRLTETALELEEVVITAERPVVNLNLTSNLATVSRQEIETLPVQELQDIVNLQAGVVEGHFRGGRIGEVQYQVDGVTVNDPYTNQSGIKLDRSLLEEVQVVSGTFDAEYGQAMSGVVNAVLKRGSETFAWDGEAYVGDAVFGGTSRMVEDEMHPLARANFVLNVTGPTGLPQTTFLMSGRRTIEEAWIYGHRRFVTTDSSDFANDVFLPTGDGEEVPLQYSREWSGLVKLSNRSLEDTEIGYQAILGRTKSRRGAWAWRLNPDGMSKQEQISIVHGFDLTHTLSASSFYSLAVRQNRVDYQDFAYESFLDPRYIDAGPPRGDDNYENGAIIQGVDLTRFTQNTNSLVFKGTFVRQFSSDQQFKMGFETQWPTVRFGVPGYLVYTTVAGNDTVLYHDNEPPEFPGRREYRPISAGGYVQNALEFDDVKIRAGLRVDFFDARSSLPGDLSNPANSIAGVTPVAPVATTAKISVAPRLGVSYPIAKDAALFFAYGHFYQLPALGQIFANADYTVLRDLQSGGISYGVLGNPDIEPERTVQYQFGYKQALTDWLGLDVTTFYKDIRDLLGVEFVSTYNNAEYARLTNVDFGNVIGFTVALDQRRRGILGSSFDYTWQLAQGNSSDPRETATRAEAGEDPRPRQVPFNWDQRHTLNVQAWLSEPEDYTVSGILRVVSGQPYTPTIETGFGGGLETNSGRKPASVQLDLRAEKHLNLAGVRPMVFARAINVFDTRFFNGFVFPSTGSPYYSRDPAADRATLDDPGRLYGPRRIEIGFRVGMSAAGSQGAS
jgi:outer membrane receptor protein involved in Fe transport